MKIEKNSLLFIHVQHLLSWLILKQLILLHHILDDEVVEVEVALTLVKAYQLMQ
jgi:hypothetical protein